MKTKAIREGSGTRDAADERSSLSFRAHLEIRESTLDNEQRSIQAVISTENPVPMFDWERGEMVPEVLISSAMELPANRQVPLLDSHQRWSVSDQLGSARQIERENGRVIGRMFFSSAAEAAWVKVREGHARDVSAGYQVLERTYVPSGQTKEIDGRRFHGPVNVVTRWKLREVSLTPIGADEQAKLRGLRPDAMRNSPHGKGFAMNPELKALCEERGMPKDLSDDDAQKWLVANLGKIETPAGAARSVDASAGGVALEVKPESKTATNSGRTISDEEIRRITTEAIANAMKREREEAAQRDAEIRALCDLAGFPDELDRCRGLADIDAIRKHLLELRRTQETAVSPAPHVRITGEGYTRLMADMGTALSLRACQSVADKKETVDAVFPEAERAKNHAQFRNCTLFQMAEECLRGAGIDIRGYTREEVAIAVMFGPERVGMRTASAAALHVTGNFLKLTQDALNKSMQIGYSEYPSTWEGPMRRGESAEDFKTIHRMRLGAIPNLPVWPDNVEPQKVSFADADETYAVECRSAEISFSYRLLVNDDMSVLTRTPAQLGQAARRTVNAVAWAQITGNPTMSDGVALFSAASGNRKRSNFTASGAVPSVAQLQVGTNLMMQMRGENTPEGNESDDVLAVQPRYIVGPSNLRTTINQLVLSAYDPASNAFQRYNTATELIPVIEPILDAASTTAWYLFASPAQIDTAEVTFLRGQERPVVRQFADERTLAQNWIVLQTFAAKALNHRGIYKDNGA